MPARKDRLFVRLGQVIEGAAEGPSAIAALVLLVLVISRGLGWW
jgi:hypothetical protein